MVVLVGAVLALIYMSLKPKQDENIANDTRNQILSAVHVSAPSESELPDTYNKYITQDLLIDSEGNIVDSTKNCAFDVDMKKNAKLVSNERQLPVFKCTLDDGSIKYIIPVYGAGLWGPIWGYVAINDDGNTIYGANFSHSSETPGLGARITEASFQKQYEQKLLYKEGELKNVTVVKKGQTSTDGSDYVDAISGATITSRGVATMMHDCMAAYDQFFKKLQSENNK